MNNNMLTKNHKFITKNKIIFGKFYCLDFEFRISKCNYKTDVQYYIYEQNTFIRNKRSH